MAETTSPHQQVQERVRKLVERIQGLPTLPVMLNNINQMILNPRTSPKEVAHVISNDPSLTSKVLRVVNSSFYGFPNRITTVTHAIVILGFNTIKSIVLSSTIFDVFRRGAKPGASISISIPPGSPARRKRPCASLTAEGSGGS